MDEFRWIQMFSCLMLMIQIPVSVTKTSIFIKVGDDVTLPCLNVTDDQNYCDGTTWLFVSKNRPSTVELINLGQINEEAKTESDRLSVTENCSLVIKKLTADDVGHYYCDQYEGGQTRDKHTLVHQSLVHLSIVSLTEHNDTRTHEVTLSCSVLTYEWCYHTVKWLNNGQQVDKNNNQIKTSQTGCSTTVTFPKSHYLYSPGYNTLKCEVTEADTGRVQRFPISPQPSGEETGNTETTKKPTIKTDSSTKSFSTPTTTNDPPDWQSTQLPDNATISNPSKTVIVWSIAGAVVAVTLLITAVFVIRWKKTKGNETQVEENAVDSEVSYATISYTKKTNRKIRVRDDDEGDRVTYSTVKAPPTSAAATTDPNNLYSPVGFPVT